MFKIYQTSILPIALVFLVSSQANADLILTFSIDGGNSFGDSFAVDRDSSLQIGIWAQENGSNTEFSTQGLVSFGLDLELADPGAGVISSASQNPLFDVENTNNTTVNGFEWEFGESAGSGIAGQTIFLGVFQFDMISDEETLFTVTDRLLGSGVGSASWITPSFGILDEQIFGAGADGSFDLTLIVNSVPEPNSVALVSITVFTLLFRRRRNCC